MVSVPAGAIACIDATFDAAIGIQRDLFFHNGCLLSTKFFSFLSLYVNIGWLVKISNFNLPHDGSAS